MEVTDKGLNATRDFIYNFCYTKVPFKSPATLKSATVLRLLLLELT